MEYSFKGWIDRSGWMEKEMRAGGRMSKVLLAHDELG